MRPAVPGNSSKSTAKFERNCWNRGLDTGLPVAFGLKNACRWNSSRLDVVTAWKYEKIPNNMSRKASKLKPFVRNTKSCSNSLASGICCLLLRMRPSIRRLLASPLSMRGRFSSSRPGASCAARSRAPSLPEGIEPKSESEFIASASSVRTPKSSRDSSMLPRTGSPNSATNLIAERSWLRWNTMRPLKWALNRLPFRILSRRSETVVRIRCSWAFHLASKSLSRSSLIAAAPRNRFIWPSIVKPAALLIVFAI